jgi:hypothetical protein
VDSRPIPAAEQKNLPRIPEIPLNPFLNEINLGGLVSWWFKAAEL